MSSVLPIRKRRQVRAAAKQIRTLPRKREHSRRAAASSRRAAPFLSHQVAAAGLGGKKHVELSRKAAHSVGMKSVIAALSAVSVDSCSVARLRRLPLRYHLRPCWTWQDCDSYSLKLAHRLLLLI